MSNDVEMPHRQRFRLALMSYPRLAQYWDTHGDTFRDEALKAEMGVMAHGEQVMAGFFISVWCGNNEGFDFIDAVSVLGNKEKQTVINWFIDPFWP